MILRTKNKIIYLKRYKRRKFCNVRYNYCITLKPAFSCLQIGLCKTKVIVSRDYDWGSKKLNLRSIFKKKKWYLKMILDGDSLITWKMIMLRINYWCCKPCIAIDPLWLQEEIWPCHDEEGIQYKHSWESGVLRARGSQVSGSCGKYCKW